MSIYQNVDKSAVDIGGLYCSTVSVTVHPLITEVMPLDSKMVFICAS